VTDGTAADAASTTSVTFELANTGIGAINLDGSYNRDCNPPYLTIRDAESGMSIYDRPTFLTCRCDNCAASACTGLADSGPAFAELPPGGSLRVVWDGMNYACLSGRSY
jgi:hypothetical protein